MDKLSYALGINIGSQFKSMGANNLCVDDFAQAIKDVFTNNKLQLNHEEAKQLINKFFTEVDKKQKEKLAEESKNAKAAGEAFLKDNAKKAGIQVLPSGLQYEIIEEGKGKKPTATSQVRCHYEGALINGTKFDSSYDRGEPAVFGLNQVIKGWTEGLQLMSEGSKYRLFIPYNLGYGEYGAGASIPPFAALIFVVELLEVL